MGREGWEGGGLRGCLQGRCTPSPLACPLTHLRQPSTPSVTHPLLTRQTMAPSLRWRTWRWSLCSKSCERAAAAHACMHARAAAAPLASARPGHPTRHSPPTSLDHHPARTHALPRAHPPRRYDRSTLFWALLWKLVSQGSPKRAVVVRGGMWAQDDAHGTLPTLHPPTNTLSACSQGQFWSAHQRFFKMMLMACKVPACARLAQDAINDGAPGAAHSRPALRPLLPCTALPAHRPLLPALPPHAAWRCRHVRGDRPAEHG